MINDIKKILVTEEQLAKRAVELANEIEKDYNGEEFVAIFVKATYYRVWKRFLGKKFKKYEKLLFSVSNSADSVCRIELVTLFAAY